MNRNIRQILWISLIVKFCVAIFVPLTLDEQYYFLWGQNLSLSYFDHPPMVGWLMFFSQPLRAIAEGAIRWPFLLMSHGTLWIWLKILDTQLSDKRKFSFLLVALLNPLWGMGVFVATPDIPLIFFWSLALYFCGQLLLSDKLSAYLGLGMALGFAFLSKYQVALFLPCLVVMLWQQKLLKKIVSGKAMVSVLLALLFCSPVFIWNYQHDWASINFQWNHGMNFKYWKWTHPLEYIFSQIFILFPTFLLFLFGKDQAWKKHWLAAFAFFPFVFFLYSSFKGRVEGNWVIMAVPAVYALSALYSSDKVWKYCTRTLYLWALVFVLALGVVFFRNHLPENNIKLFEAQKYNDLLNEIEEGKKYYVFSYQLASFLTFKTGKLFCKLPGYGRADHYQYLEECQDYKDGFSYLTEENDNRNYEEKFPGLVELGTRSLENGFKVVEVGRR